MDFFGFFHISDRNFSEPLSPSVSQDAVSLALVIHTSGVDTVSTRFYFRNLMKGLALQALLLTVNYKTEDLRNF